MFVYEKRLEYPIKIKNTNPKLAALIISQYGGPYTGRVRPVARRAKKFLGLQTFCLTFTGAESRIKYRYFPSTGKSEEKRGKTL